MLRYEKVNPPKDPKPTDKLCLSCSYKYPQLNGVVCNQCANFIAKYTWSGNTSAAYVDGAMYLIWYVDMNYDMAISGLKDILQNEKYKT